MDTGSRTRQVILTGMFAAVLAVMAQLSIPMPSGVPVTLQTFAVALTAYVLGPKTGLAAAVIYILLGAVGVPVFAGFKGGIGVLLGPTGGFIWGFLLMILLCGSGAKSRHILLTAAASVFGLAGCHLPGILQFMFLTGRGFAGAAMLVSVPYLIKDVISVAAAFALAKAVKRGIRAAGSL